VLVRRAQGPVDFSAQQIAPSRALANLTIGDLGNNSTSDSLVPVQVQRIDQWHHDGQFDARASGWILTS
jgi:hypothetical protein